MHSKNSHSKLVQHVEIRMVRPEGGCFPHIRTSMTAGFSSSAISVVSKVIWALVSHISFPSALFRLVLFRQRKPSHVPPVSFQRSFRCRWIARGRISSPDSEDTDKQEVTVNDLPI